MRTQSWPAGRAEGIFHRMDDRFTRRHMLGLLGAVPLSAAITGCGEPLTPRDAGSRDAGRADAGGSADASMRDASMRDASTRDASMRDASMGDASMVDAGSCTPTERDAVGPFFEEGSPSRTQIAALDEPGDRLFIAGRVASVASCSIGLSGYTLDIWQADGNGDYHGPGDDFRLRGRVTTDPEGRFAFETIMPGRYATGAGLRPAHLHVRAYSPAGLTLVTTQLYFAGDPYLGSADGCQPPTCFSDDPARTLALRPATMEGRMGMASDVELIVAG